MLDLLEMQKKNTHRMQKYRTDVFRFDRLTRGLSAMQRAILRELRDAYLHGEGPLSEQDFEILGSANPDVEKVKTTFFKASKTGYSCHAFDEELKAEIGLREKRRKAAKSSKCQQMLANASKCHHLPKSQGRLPRKKGSKLNPSASLGRGDYRGDGSEKDLSIESDIINPPLILPPEWLQKVGAWFGRTESRFTDVELEKAAQIGEPGKDDLATLERYYVAKHPTGRDYRRRSVYALLFFWSEELDRARVFKRSNAQREAAL